MSDERSFFNGGCVQRPCNGSELSQSTINVSLENGVVGGQQQAAVNHHTQLSAADDNQSGVDNTERPEEPIDMEWRVIYENLQVCLLGMFRWIHMYVMFLSHFAWYV